MFVYMMDSATGLCQKLLSRPSRGKGREKHDEKAIIHKLIAMARYVIPVSIGRSHLDSASQCWPQPLASSRTLEEGMTAISSAVSLETMPDQGAIPVRQGQPRLTLRRARKVWSDLCIQRISSNKDA